jgi:hypothetical protein
MLRHGLKHPQRVTERAKYFLQNRQTRVFNFKRSTPGLSNIRPFRLEIIFPPDGPATGSAEGKK